MYRLFFQCLAFYFLNLLSYSNFKTGLLFFLLCGSTLYAQNKVKIDSLKKELRGAKSEQRFEILNALFKENNSNDFNEALHFAEEFNNQAIANGDSVRIVQGGRMRAYSLMYLGRNTEAVDVLIGILGIAKRNQNKFPDLKTQIKFILNNAGLAYMYLGNYDKALSFHYQSLAIREEEGDKKSIRNALNNIGLVFYNLNDDDKAIQFYLKAVAISKELKDFTGQERLFINLGLSYNHLNKFDEAIKFFNDGFKICGSQCDENTIKEGMIGLGLAYLKNHQMEIARENFLKSLKIAKSQKDKRYEAENLSSLGEIEIQLNNDAKGIAYLMEAKAIAESVNLAEAKLTIYRDLAKYYEDKKDFGKSLEYKNKYVQFKDSIYSEQLLKNLTKVQTNFEERENIKTIAEKDQLVALQKEIIVRQQRQNYSIIAITFLVVLLALVLYYFIRQQQKANYKISQAKIQIEEQNTQLAEYNKLLEAKVEERTNYLIITNKALLQANEELDYFIYKTSHDIRGPLATLKGMCNVSLMDIKDEVTVKYLRMMDETADRMYTILTRLMIVSDISNSVLVPRPIDFKEILEELFTAERKKNLPPRFSLSYTIETAMTLVSDTALVKMVLENLLSNAIKFYNDSGRIEPFVKIKVFDDGENVKLTVEDNGIGINLKEGEAVFKMFMRASERSEIGGIGLYLSKLATEKIGGTISLVRSEITGSGSLFEVVIPPDLKEVIKTRVSSEKNLFALIENQS